jgi:hypothetical protein
MAVGAGIGRVCNPAGVNHSGVAVGTTLLTFTMNSRQGLWGRNASFANFDLWQVNDPQVSPGDTR